MENYDELGMNDIARRYKKSKRTLQRWIKNREFPKHDAHLGQNPMWRSDTVQAFDLLRVTVAHLLPKDRMKAIRIAVAEINQRREQSSGSALAKSSPTNGSARAIAKV